MPSNEIRTSNRLIFRSKTLTGDLNGRLMAWPGKPRQGTIYAIFAASVIAPPRSNDNKLYAFMNYIESRS